MDVALPMVGKDAREDSEIIFAPGARLADVSNAGSELVIDSNTVKLFRPDGRLYTLNDNGGTLFHGDFVMNDRFRHNGSCQDVNRWVASTNGAEQIGLVAPKTSDTLIFRLQHVPSGLETSPIRPLPQDVQQDDSQSFVRPGVNSALTSAAFLIRSVAADEQDIDPEEFDICYIRLASLGHDPTGRERYSGEFILADHLANGSGFTRWLGETLHKILGKIVRAAEVAAAGQPLTIEEHGEFLAMLYRRSHVNGCNWSCYTCLRNFRNMRYHPLLDWRLGTTMVRILKDETEQAGLDGDWQKIELQGWLDTAAAHAESFVQNFRSGGPEPFALIGGGPLPILRFGQWNVVVRHPLWDTRDPRGIFAEAITEAAVQGHGEGNVLSVDSFDLSLRPSWVFQKLQFDEGVFRL
jgi:hypothetical protein